MQKQSLEDLLEKIPQPLMLFDGECYMCSGSVQWILSKEANDSLNFCSMQSEAGKRICAGFDVNLPKSHTTYNDTFAFIEGDACYVRSPAAIHISKYLRQPYKFLGCVLFFVPKPLRNLAYRSIARNRYLLWGKRDNGVCW